MSKAKARTTGTPQQIDATVPLRNISITWPHRSVWGEGVERRTVTGSQLASLLNILGHRVGETADQHEATVDLAADRLQALEDILRAASGENPRAFDLDPSEAFAALAGILRPIWMDLRIEKYGAAEVLKSAVVTIGAPSDASVTGAKS